MKEEKLEKILDKIHEWIFSVDQKIGMYLAFQGIVIVLVFPYILKRIKNINESIFIELVFIIAIMLMGLGFYYSLSGIIPKINNKKGNSLLFFADIAELSEREYKNKIEKVQDNEYKDDLISQIIFSSKIAKKKHIHLRDAMIFFTIGIILVGLLYLFFSYVS